MPGRNTALRRVPISRIDDPRYATVVKRLRGVMSDAEIEKLLQNIRPEDVETLRSYRDPPQKPQPQPTPKNLPNPLDDIDPLAGMSIQTLGGGVRQYDPTQFGGNLLPIAPVSQQAARPAGVDGPLPTTTPQAQPPVTQPRPPPGAARQHLGQQNRAQMAELERLFGGDRQTFQ